MTLPVVSIVGVSGSGKTTLLVKVVAELVKRGWRVNTLKHDAHGFSIDRKGKDSWKHKKAGASSVALSCPDKIAVIKDVKKEWPAERIIAGFLLDADVVITEGYKKAASPKIEVVRAKRSKKPVCAKDPLLLAFASDMLLPGHTPVYKLNDFRGIAALIEKKIIKKHKPASVTLIADNAAISLKPFIENLIRDGVSGMVKSLKGVRRAREIEIRIKNR
ncbi:MAG: molybdopterin-guanine dinucleotide biosynthesis protein B [Deltaproteobacteria bacterium]|nr:molybdopterin-guanine dinucleotide biosynthesis protein B [Deltaproteobacteria bacterium]